MPTFPASWTLYVESAGATITAQAVFTADSTGESGSVTATGSLGGTYSGNWTETPNTEGNMINFSLTRNGSSIKLLFSGFRVLYAMGGTVTVTSGGQPVAGWSGCTTPSNTAQKELEF